MAKKTNYQKLQDRAKELNIRYVGVSAAQLEDDIAAAEAGFVAGDNGAETEATVENEAVSPEDANAALILNSSGNEIRRYTLEDHGDNFAELAASFAEKNDLEVVLRNVMPAIVCPHCGGKIQQD